MDEPTLAEILLTTAERDRQAFAKLAKDPNLHDSLCGFHAQQAVEKGLKAVRRGNPGFSRDPQTLRSAKALPSGVYAEVNLSANHLRDQIKTLLDVFEIEPTALRIYLRQDRDAEPA